MLEDDDEDSCMHEQAFVMSGRSWMLMTAAEGKLHVDHIAASHFLQKISNLQPLTPLSPGI